MARKSVNTTPVAPVVEATPVTPVAEAAKSSKRTYDLNHFMDRFNNTGLANHTRLEAGANAIKRLYADRHEQTTPREDAAYLRSIVASMWALCDEKALLAEADAGRGIGSSTAGLVASLLAQLAEEREKNARLVAAQAAPAAPAAPAPRKGGRVAVK